jgi:uncharacterized protein YhfF
MTPQCLAYWARFKAVNPSVSDSRLYEAFCFGDSEGLANELGALVVAGTKRATTGSLWALEAARKSPPQPGDLSIVTTWSGEPLCVIETTHVEIIPFSEVGAEFAANEGEGDGSLAYWRSAHASYFGRECARIGRHFSSEMPVVCERFKVVGLDFKRGPSEGT